MISKDKKQITIALPKNLVNCLDEIVEKSEGNITKSHIIESALYVFLGMCKQAQKEQKSKNKKEEA